MTRTPEMSEQKHTVDSPGCARKLSPEEQKAVVREAERYIRWAGDKGLLGNARKHPLAQLCPGPATSDSGTGDTPQSPLTVDPSETGVEARLSASQVDETLFSLQLRGVRLYEVQVERLRAKRAAKAHKKPALQTEIRVDRTPKSLLGWLSVEILFPNRESPEYRLRLTLQSVFEPRDASTPLPTEDQFDHRLACTILTMLWPYARETTHDLMRRMEVEAFALPTIDKVMVQKVAEVHRQETKQGGTET